MVAPAPQRPIRRVTLVAHVQHGGLCDSVRRGFEAAGVVVTTVPFTNWFPNLHRPGIRGTGALNLPARSALRPALELRLVAEVARSRPDMTLVLKCDDLHAPVYGALRRAGRGAPVAAFHPDDPFNAGQLVGRRWRPGPAHRRALTQLRSVDLYLVWSRELVARARAQGARRAEWLPFGWDPALHQPVAPELLTEEDRATYGADVVFVGNWDEERERWLGGLCDGLAARGRREVTVAVWGNAYWQSRCKHPAVRAAWRGRPLVGDEMAKAAAASTVGVNVLRLQNKDACNMRTFEWPGLGGAMLHERSRELPALFEPGVACADFATPDELCDEALALVDDRRRRDALAAAGAERVHAWTYEAWARRVLGYLAG